MKHLILAVDHIQTPPEMVAMQLRLDAARAAIHAKINETLKTGDCVDIMLGNELQMTMYPDGSVSFPDNLIRR